MRIERTGNIEKLTPRLTAFLQSSLGGISLDLNGDVETRPDFVCLRGLMAVEIKPLESDPSERLYNAVRPETEREEWPRFFGAWPLQSVLKNLPDAERVQRTATERLGRAIVAHVQKANDQLAQHARRHPRRNAIRTLILINEDHEEYGPNVVSWLVGRELLRKREDGSRRNRDIDVVIYLSERHATNFEEQVTFPVGVIPSPELSLDGWQNQVLQLVLQRWAGRNQAPLKANTGLGLDAFEAVEHVPDSMRRHELWRLEYRRRPYMRNWRDEDLREQWDVIMLTNMLAGVKGSPKEIPMDGWMRVMEQFSHLQEEIARRGLPLPFFKPEPERIEHAISLLTYGEEVASWLRAELAHLLAPNSTARENVDQGPPL